MIVRKRNEILNNGLCIAILKKGAGLSSDDVLLIDTHVYVPKFKCLCEEVSDAWEFLRDKFSCKLGDFPGEFMVFQV